MYDSINASKILENELNKDELENKFEFTAPFGFEPSLKFMANELGVDFDRFIEGLNVNKSDLQLAKEFNCSIKAIEQLKERFMKYGLDSIVGQD